MTVQATHAVPHIAIVTCSDTRDITQDSAGAALEQLVEAQGWEVVSHVVVKDERDQISAAIVHATDDLMPMWCSPAVAVGFRCAM